jgi:hypothetical protein
VEVFNLVPALPTHILAVVLSLSLIHISESKGLSIVIPVLLSKLITILYLNIDGSPANAVSLPSLIMPSSSIRLSNSSIVFLPAISLSVAIS